MEWEKHPRETGITRRNFLRNAAIGVGSGCTLTNLSYGVGGGTNSFVGEAAARMTYRRLGRTGLMVSSVGLGGHYNGPTHREKKADEQWMRDAKDSSIGNLQRCGPVCVTD
jgi:hypothetical protein